MIIAYILQILNIQVSFSKSLLHFDLSHTLLIIYLTNENDFPPVALLALVTLFIFGALPLAYIFSFIAKKPTSAFSSFCVLTILTGTATLTLVSLYELKYENSASSSLQLAFSLFCKLKLS